MRRADRLFSIVQFLRTRRLTTARWLADRLEVSVRTIYRDVTDLILSGVPIEGEAGVGYVLRKGLELPPLVFDRDELRALDLGLRFAQAWGPSALARAGASAKAKIRGALPAHVVHSLDEPRAFVPLNAGRDAARLDLVVEAIDTRRKIALDYRNAEGEPSHRIVRPLGSFFFPPAWSFLAWCELRNDFRSFRLDRTSAIELLDERFEIEPGRRLEDYLRLLRDTQALSLSEIDPDRLD
ncbi:MAG TPA: YafY family protein [Gammaproteobacteria bacterium]|nr:YafY family protein [Gammaproteobacteria bacterium]